MTGDGALSDNERLRQANDALRARIERHNVAARADHGARAHETAEALTRARRFVEAALEASANALMLFSDDGRLIATNAQLQALFPDVAMRLRAGIRFEDAMRLLSVAAALDIGDDAARDAWARARIAARGAGAAPAVAPLTGGRWVELVERRAGPTAFAVALDDVSDRMAARLRARARRRSADVVARDALDQLPIGLAAFGADGGLALWNEPFRQLLGLGLGEMREGVSFAQLARRLSAGLGADRGGPARRVGVWIAGPAPREPLTVDLVSATGALLEATCRDTADGGFAVSIAAVTAERRAAEEVARIRSTLEGRVTERTAALIELNDRLVQEVADGGFAVSIADVTAERRAAEEVARIRSTLEGRVTERTAALIELNDRLVQEVAERRAIETEMRHARDAAEAANLSKTRFLAAASHDLLQPLNAAKLFLSALSAAELPAEAGAMVGKVESAFGSVEALLSALLDISKLDAGGGEARPCDFPVDRVLTPIAEEFGPLAAARGLKLKVAPSRAVVRSDPHYLRRIVQNLVSNALKYTETGGVVVGCRRRGRSLRIEVWDSGVGIPAAERRRVFEEFHRIEAGNPRAERGMGLGLTIVDRAARLLGHGVDIRSVEGGGSVLSVTLAQGAQPAEAVTPDLAPERQGPGLEQGMIALVLDDDDAVRDATAALLGRWGVDCLTAADEAGALAHVAQLGMAPDVLLLDYHLGDGRSGLEALAALRAGGAGDSPAIVATADRSRAVAEAVRAAGAQLLTKPVAPARLRALLHWSRAGVAAAAE